jgi:uncharacterized ferritin-like protein (DUF455 family)
MSFLAELSAFKDERLAAVVGDGTFTLDGTADATRLLQVALGNEINVSDLAAAWMPSTRELDVKLAFARQVGDEANHFALVSDRLAALGFDVAAFQPATNPMFEYLRGLTSTVERIAAGLFTLESIAYAVNEGFMALCAARGDDETVRIYREYIQPDERAHQLIGQRLLAAHAVTAAQQQVARDTAGKLIELASATRAAAAARLGTRCFPGC